jgi:heme/copper-type cytochrome/quinol oxidase subunit 1
MAITETRPAIETSDEPSPTDLVVGLADHDPGGLAGFIGTGDHKALGRAYIFGALLLGVAAVALDGLYHAHQAKSFLPNDTVGQIYTLSHIGLVLLFAIPLFIGLGTYLTPLQVGARTIAFPRAAALAFWGWIIGALLLIGAYVINGGPDGGRFKGVDLSYVALALIIVSILLATVCILTTVIALRTPGLHLTRIPMFSWAMVVAGSLWIFTLPVLLGNILLIYVDHHYGDGSSFSQAQWGQLWWFFGPPQVYVVAIPALGAITDMVATLAGRRLERRGLMMTAIAAFGLLSFGAYAQPYYSPQILNQAVYVFMGVAIVLPMLALLAGWVTTLRGSKPLLKSSLLFSLGGAVTLLIATFGGALYVIKPLQLHDPAWIDRGTPPFADGQMLLVVSATALVGLGALVHWAPKLFGRFVADGPAKLAAVVGLVGGLLAGLPLLVYGFSLKVSGLADSASALNGASAAGGMMMVVAIILVVIGLISGGRGEELADDAWGRGQTIEWATTSPPPLNDFGLLPLVESAEPLLDATDSQEAS